MQYDDTGPQVQWRVKAGDPIVKTWDVYVDGVLYNVSGATATGRISESEGGATVATLVMSNPTSTSVKAKYGAGLNTPGVTYWWAIRLILADGATAWRGQGPFIVEPAGV